MAKYSHKMGGKEVGQAAVYAEPHTMKGKKVTPKLPTMQDPNNVAADKVTGKSAANRVSQGNPADKGVKTSGIKMRGVGAAIKGTMSRGPMA
jgi:hypothetical protein